MYFSRISTGRKMGYSYEISGTKGAIRFDQEDQNALWLYRAEGPDATRGFTKILTGPGTPGLRTLLSGTGSWDRLPGSDHHRGQGLPDRHRNRQGALADLPRRNGGQPDRRCRSRIFRNKNLAGTWQRSEHLKGYARMTIRIGNAPCSWGVEFADDPRNPSWQQVLKECAAAGYKGIELGPVGFMPEDPAKTGGRAGRKRAGTDRRRGVPAVSRPRTSGTT